MQDFFKKNLAHLTEEETDFARIEFKEILAEWESEKEAVQGSKLFKKSPELRELEGQCLAKMRYIPHPLANAKEARPELFTSSYMLTFKRACCDVRSKFDVNEYVTVSTSKAYAFLMGFIEQVEGDSLTIRSDKPFPYKRLPDQLYHVDKHKGFSKFATRMGNVVVLMQNTEEAAKLRSDAMVKKREDSQDARTNLTN